MDQLSGGGPLIDTFFIRCNDPRIARCHDAFNELFDILLHRTFGVHAALSGVPETRIKTWLGHSRLSTTEIYLDLAAPEDRAMMERMWAGSKPIQTGTAPPLHTGPDGGRVMEEASTHEVVRVVNAFSAIQDAGKRREFLGTVEACVQGERHPAESHNHAV